jgi:hypothetical protein
MAIIAPTKFVGPNGFYPPPNSAIGLLPPRGESFVQVFYATTTVSDAFAAPYVQPNPAFHGRYLSSTPLLSAAPGSFAGIFSPLNGYDQTTSHATGLFVYNPNTSPVACLIWLGLDRAFHSLTTPVYTVSIGRPSSTLGSNFGGILGGRIASGPGPHMSTGEIITTHPPGMLTYETLAFFASEYPWNYGPTPSRLDVALPIESQEFWLEPLHCIGLVVRRNNQILRSAFPSSQYDGGFVDETFWLMVAQTLFL